MVVNKKVLAAAIEAQIEALSEDSKRLMEKLKRGEELTKEERIQLNANSDRIGQHLRELEKLGEL